MITKEKANRILLSIQNKIMNHERFLNKVGFILTMTKYSQEQKDEILKDACWVDGTIAGQVHYVQQQRMKLLKSYEVLKNKFIELKLIS